MYQSQVPPDRGGRELVAQEQPKQNPSSLSINCGTAQTSHFFPQSSLHKARRFRAGAAALGITGLMTCLSACTYRNIGTDPATAGGRSTTSSLSEISCGTQSLTGSQSKACSVYLSGPAGSPTVVDLTSSNSALKVPSAVTVATGATSAGFDAVSSAVTKALSVTITASADDVTETDVITLYPEATTSTISLSKISCGTQTLTGPTTKDCSVYLSAAANSAIKVSLSSSNNSLQVPSTVMVPEGSVTGGFTATASAVTTTQSATLTATADGVSKTDVIQLEGSNSQPQPIASLSKVSCGTQTLTGPTTAACSVYLSAAADTAIKVSLSSSNSSLQVPSTVMVPEGSATAGFTATASAVSKTQSATLTATANGASQTDVIQLDGSSEQPGPTVSLSKLSCGTSTLTGPTTTACTVFLSTGTVSALNVSLSSSNSALKVPPIVTVGAGSASAAFTATASAVTTTQSATLTATAGGVSKTDVIQLGGSSATLQYQVELNWIAPNSTDSIAGYRVYRANGGSTSFQLLNSTIDVNTSFTDSTVQTGKSYEYEVTSVDSNGTESSPSNSAEFTIP